MRHASNSPAGLLHFETGCRGRELSHNALAGASRPLCPGRNPFVVRSWSKAFPGRQRQIHPHRLPAEMIVRYVSASRFNWNRYLKTMLCDVKY